MLPSLTLAFIDGLLLGSQVSYFPLVISCVLLLVVFVGVAFERSAVIPARLGSWCLGCLLVRPPHSKASKSFARMRTEESGLQPSCQLPRAPCIIPGME